MLIDISGVNDLGKDRKGKYCRSFHVKIMQG